MECEFDSLDLGDKRLNARAVRVLQALFADPQASINAAAQGWTETHAAYRFLDNDHVSSEELLRAHREATVQRMREHAVVLVVQDTTELDYSGHAPAGAGPLNFPEQLGFLDHSHLAFTPTGLCLGVVAAKIWARSAASFGGSQKRKHEPLETKETFRWLEGYRLACDLQREIPAAQIISVADAEGDIYELFVEREVQGAEAADYVIRAGKNRSLPEESDTGIGYEKLRATMVAAPLVTVRELELSVTPKRAARIAQLEIRSRSVCLKAPYRKEVSLPNVEVKVVLVEEVNPPAGVERIEWLLITSLPIDTREQVLRVVDTYVGRWPIEVFFRVLKTGCQVERIQLETAPRLMRCLMLYKIVAWRVLYLTMLGRECPQLPCEVLFTADEWMPVWKITQTTPLPALAPPLSKFLLMLGELGGHNGRAGDLPPGPQALWTGIRRMTDFALAWRAFGPQSTPGQETSDTCV